MLMKQNIWKIGKRVHRWRERKEKTRVVGLTGASPSILE